ncbi:glutathione peroxidase [Paludibacter sp. 221]|uniref:glutathione peroxidase n=1 Tax=Paludibacter sp. 221 TaxID=2302939 RepID=UPI0013D4AAFD|nr:glutathione peroxidase [Paludibacter sp. 221]NDV46087.1 glutathione peroxidase [Paludibacter sp. 221]
MKIYDYQVKDAKGNLVSMSDYQGKVLLIVNTATGCGFTPQYKGLQELYEKYKNKGFEILDFPCNQFGHQAPDTNDEIQNFCELKYKTTFKLFSKIEVNGKNEEPLYTYLKSQKGGFFNRNIKWNFTKFLVDKDGKVVERFSPATKPEKLESKIQSLL